MTWEFVDSRFGWWALMKSRHFLVGLDFLYCYGLLGSVVLVNRTLVWRTKTHSVWGKRVLDGGRVPCEGLHRERIRSRANNAGGRISSVGVHISKECSTAGDISMETSAHASILLPVRTRLCTLVIRAHCRGRFPPVRYQSPSRGG